MKKIITTVLALTLVSPAYANEIAGTRVEGQGAICAEGQGKALEINIALKKEFSYCIELPKPIPTPTVSSTPLPTSTPTVTTTAITQTQTTTQTTEVSTGSTISTPITTETSTVTTTPRPTPTPTSTVTLPAAPLVPERSNVIEANVTTKVTTVREETVEEWLGRILRGWTNWYEGLMAWFATIFG